MKVARPDQLIQRFVITTDVIPASLIIGIFSSVSRKDPGFLNQSCIFSIPSIESWYLSQPPSFRRFRFSLVR